MYQKMRPASLRASPEQHTKLHIAQNSYALKAFINILTDQKRLQNVAYWAHRVLGGWIKIREAFIMLQHSCLYYVFRRRTCSDTCGGLSKFAIHISFISGGNPEGCRLMKFGASHLWLITLNVFFYIFQKTKSFFILFTDGRKGLGNNSNNPQIIMIKSPEDERFQISESYLN
jgi:hypothetical protein